MILAAPDRLTPPRLTLPRAALGQLRAHAEQAYPHECCGALLGTYSAPHRLWTVTAAVSAHNACAQAARTRYAIAPRELVAIQHQALRQGLEIAGFYHSHPDHPPQWSRLDLEEAHWIGCCYLITEVAQGKAAATNAFWLAGSREEDKHFIPLAVEIAETP